VTVLLPSLRLLADTRGFTMGAAVNPTASRNDAEYRQVLATQYNSVTSDDLMQWHRVHPQPGQYDFLPADSLVGYAQTNAMAVHGHALIWHSSLPTWVTGGTFTKAQLLAVIKDHIETIVGHYRGQIATWDVVNEALDDNGAWRRSQWYTVIGPEYVDSAFVWAHRADPTARLYYNDYGGESMMTPKADSIFVLVSQLRARGIPVDGIGLQMHFSLDWIPPVSSVLQNMNRLALLGLDIRVSEFDVGIKDSQSSSSAALAQQAAAYGDMLGTCLSVPRCRAFTSWGFTDLYSWVPGYFPGWGSALPFDSLYQTKPAFHAMIARLSDRQGVASARDVQEGLAEVAVLELFSP
jgi:endo-1,4-beta-xylanase